MDEETTSQYWSCKKKALIGYEAGSSTYDRLYGEEQQRKYDSCSRYLNQVSNKFVLDCGCGTGMLLRRFLGEKGFFIGVDYSRAMLKQALSRVKLASNIDLICGDADTLPFKSGTFDRVLSFTMLGNMPEIERTIREFGRVAKDSARIVLSFSKKNIGANDVLKSVEKASIRPRELIDDQNLKDWIVVGDKVSGAWLKRTEID